MVVAAVAVVDVEDIFDRVQRAVIFGENFHWSGHSPSDAVEISYGVLINFRY